jgi:RND superfamily putative drug exporter
MGLGGIAAVLLAMTGALTVLPALLAVLGPRINALRIPLPGRNRQTGHPGQQVWAALARAVMRRPVHYLAAVVAVLAILAIPFGHAHFGGLDERILPPGSQPRMVTARIQAEFPRGTTDPIQVVLRGATPLQAQQLATRIQVQRGITGVRPAGSRGDTTLLAVGYAGASTGPQASDAVHAIRSLPVPAGVTMLVGGRTAQDMDRIHSLAVYLPWMAAIMATVTLVLLFLAFGSVLLPVKAVVMNLVSIGASFGVVVWIFQDGHLSHLLGFTATGFLEPSTPVFLLAVLFGLATDYEVFLLARVREEYDATGDNTTAVTAGLQRTGQIITSAALLLIVVLAGLATGQVVFAKIIGIGMLTAITVDAALVRTLLVPATMRLLGRWNWWAPGPLAAFYRRYGISETTGDSPAEPRPTTPALTE